MRLLLTILIAASSSVAPAFAAETICEAWFQAPGGVLEKTKMSVSESTPRNTTYSVTAQGYDFRVNWDFELTTFYVWIEQAGKKILGTTARVPTLNHPENFTDLNLPNGPRLSVNCEMK